MSTRSLIAATVAAGFLVAAAPAAAQSPTDNPAPGAVPGACTDPFKPTSSFTAKAARRATRSRVLRGTAKDVGCGVDLVVISIARKADGKCRLVKGKRLARRTSCKRRHWTSVKGTSSWTYRLSKKLPAGKYVVRTRVRDFAGNVRNSAPRRMRLR
jgi:hypothetical protein